MIPSAMNSDDAALFDSLYDEQCRVVYAYLMGQCGDAELAADLLQETFLRVWRHIADIRQIPAERRRFYLFTTAKNLALDELRRQRTRRHYAATQECPSPAPNPDSDPAQNVIAQETAARMNNAIHDLPPDLRTVLSLRMMADKNSAEIGALLNLPAGTVRYRLSEARRRIAKFLENENP
jgi:RNA polymerase sigma-70 factor (ECF subfamily)